MFGRTTIPINLSRFLSFVQPTSLVFKFQETGDIRSICRLDLVNEPTASKHRKLGDNWAVF